MKITTDAGHREIYVDEFMSSFQGRRKLQLGVINTSPDEPESVYAVLNKMEFEALVAAGREVFGR